MISTVPSFEVVVRNFSRIRLWQGPAGENALVFFPAILNLSITCGSRFTRWA